jgi:hypothetical protein
MPAFPCSAPSDPGWGLANQGCNHCRGGNRDLARFDGPCDRPCSEQSLQESTAKPSAEARKPLCSKVVALLALAVSLALVQGVPQETLALAHSSWSVLPIGGSTLAGPAAAIRKGELNLIVRGTDSRLYHTAMSAGVWTGWTPLGGVTLEG